MGNIFSGTEIVEIGIQIEKNGRDFYNALVTQSGSENAREAFKFLAGEEEKHIAVFKKILNSLQEYEPAESYPGEYFAYMNTLAREYVFTQENKGAETAKKATSDKEAIEMGIGFEKDSIIFYERMKRVVPEYNLKTVDELIRQEEAHLQLLSELKQKL